MIQPRQVSEYAALPQVKSVRQYVVNTTKCHGQDNCLAAQIFHSRITRRRILVVESGCGSASSAGVLAQTSLPLVSCFSPPTLLFSTSPLYTTLHSLSPSLFTSPPLLIQSSPVDDFPLTPPPISHLSKRLIRHQETDSRPLPVYLDSTSDPNPRPGLELREEEPRLISASERLVYRQHVQGIAQRQECHQRVFISAGQGPKWCVRCLSFFVDMNTTPWQRPYWCY
jgi:hypothetical protein